MSHVVVAGHWFRSITPGERCCRADCACEGVSSLVELCALDGLLKAGDKGVAHVPDLLSGEVIEIHNAALSLREHMERVMA